MNKLLHVLVYVFLLLAGAGLYLEFQLNAKRSELTDRNKILEDSLVKVANYIENEDSHKKTKSVHVDKDVAPIEAKANDDPEMSNLTDRYNENYETKSTVGTDTMSWESKRSQLRTTYVLDGEGKPVQDGTGFQMKGPGTAATLLEELEKKAGDQLARLNKTRDELKLMREALEKIVREYNELKQSARADKMTIVEREETIKTLEGEKTELEEQVTKLNGQITQLDDELTSTKRDLSSVRNDLEDQKAETAKRDEAIAKLQAQLKKAIQTGNSKNATSNVVVTQLTAGDKGEVVYVNADEGFVVVRFSEDAIKELKGENGSNPMSLFELGIRRKSNEGQSNEFICQIRIRQEIKGKPLAICDILENYQSDTPAVGDTIFANN